MRRWRTRRTLGHEFLGFRDSGRELRSAQALTAMPVVVLSRGKRVWPHNRRGDLLEELWMKLQAELAALSPASAHIVAANSGHQVHMEQPKLVAYSIAVIIDRHRLQHAGDRDAERQELSDRGGIDFRSASWLRDTLLMQPGVDRPMAGLSSAAH